MSFPASPEPAADAETTESLTFRDLGIDDDLIEVLDNAGIDEPFPIQEMTIPDALAGRDVAGKAKTGSGKTLAFGIPMIERTAKAKQRHPESLVLVPTRELASQVADSLRPLAAVRGLHLDAFYGGVPLGRQIEAARKGIDIVIATPGRMIDLIERKALSVSDLALVVLDEADRMADMGFLPQVERILRQANKKHQTLLFSATLDSAVNSLVKRYMEDPVFHEVESRSVTVDEMEHRFITVKPASKLGVAVKICEAYPRVLAFTNTKQGADQLASQLKLKGLDAKAIHGDLPQAQREKALAAFAAGRTKVLVATDVAARGIHIDGIDVVLHYDPPDDAKSYLHRSGRTARAGEKGLAVTLVLWSEQHEVRRLQRQVRINQGIVDMDPSDPRLEDLSAWTPPKSRSRQSTGPFSRGRPPSRGMRKRR
ncbi:MAG: RNA helicase [Acidobacteria bacterium]|nr:MAG: RNA helicase [Acidobacteriota bacterium]